MTEFPKVPTKCGLCRGTGKVDVSHHGSPDYEDCEYCKGEKDVVTLRDMTVEEKLNFLLGLIHEIYWR